jgi:putative salt-induced outer membrane protein YdiY
MRVHVMPVILIALAAGAPAHAQTVAEADGMWRGSFGAGVTNATGNNETFIAALNADTVRRTSVNKMTGKVLSLYGRREEDGVSELTAGLFRASARYDRDISDRTYGFMGYDLEKDKLADLQWRNSPTIGAGLHLRKTDTFTFDVFAGYSYNHEKLYDGTSRSFNEGLLGEETTHKFGSEISFNQRLVVYPNLTESGEYRLVFDAGFLAPLVDRWNLTVKYSARYQSNPPAGVEKQDTVLFTGLQYSWGPK